MSRTSSSSAESNFAQSSDFAHNIGRVVVGDDVNLVACFVGFAQLQLGSEFAEKQITRYGFDDGLHIVDFCLLKRRAVLKFSDILCFLSAMLCLIVTLSGCSTVSDDNQSCVEEEGRV